MLTKTGKIIKGFGSSYFVKSDGKIYTCSIKGKMRIADSDQHNPVAIGDNVVFEPETNSNSGVISEVLPRRSRLSRPANYNTDKEQVIVSNIDQIIAVVSLTKPKFKSGILDRILTVAEREEIDAVICLNKFDLAEQKEADFWFELYSLIGYKTILTSAVSEKGVEDLANLLKDKVSTVIGQSGVGKSSLLNCVEPNLNLKTNDISDYNEKGRHTTVHSEFFELSFGGFIADTPGIREFGLWGIDKENLRDYFKEFQKFGADCKFSNCKHITEPKCEILEALKNEKVQRVRYESYLNIFNSL